MTRAMSTQGRALVRASENDVLRAYLCPAGIWTIGVGLTKASGVVNPKAGMVITREESERLFRLALARNYEPRVNKAMPNAAQHEFDGGTSFDWNTGAIHKASWVKSWAAEAGSTKIRNGLMQWVKGGGKVLPGLKRRRAEEADVILLDKWPANLNFGSAFPLQKGDALARFVIAMDADGIEAVRAGLRQIGFEPGPKAGEIQRAAVEAFQLKYDLKADGLIGRATLATLQRELDARKKVLQGTATATGGGAVAGGNEAAAPAAPDVSAPDAPLTDVALPDLGDPLVTWLGVGVGVAGILFLLWLGYRYRDLIAARIAAPMPRAAAFLRSF